MMPMERIAPQSEVIRAILLEDSPCCEGLMMSRYGGERRCLDRYLQVSANRRRRPQTSPPLRAARPVVCCECGCVRPSAGHCPLSCRRAGGGVADFPSPPPPPPPAVCAETHFVRCNPARHRSAGPHSAGVWGGRRQGGGGDQSDAGLPGGDRGRPDIGHRRRGRDGGQGAAVLLLGLGRLHRGETARLRPVCVFPAAFGRLRHLSLRCWTFSRTARRSCGGSPGSSTAARSRGQGGTQTPSHTAQAHT